MFAGILPHDGRDFYPRSPCGERRSFGGADCSEYLISIHALLAESDLVMARLWLLSIISIHALLAESDLGRGEAV